MTIPNFPIPDTRPGYAFQSPGDVGGIDLSAILNALIAGSKLKQGQQQIDLNRQQLGQQDVYQRGQLEDAAARRGLEERRVSLSEQNAPGDREYRKALTDWHRGETDARRQQAEADKTVLSFFRKNPGAIKDDAMFQQALAGLPDNAPLDRITELRASLLQSSTAGSQAQRAEGLQGKLDEKAGQGGILGQAQLFAQLPGGLGLLSTIISANAARERQTQAKPRVIPTAVKQGYLSNTQTLQKIDEALITLGASPNDPTNPALDQPVNPGEALSAINAFGVAPKLRKGLGGSEAARVYDMIARIRVGPLFGTGGKNLTKNEREELSFLPHENRSRQINVDRLRSLRAWMLEQNAGMQELYSPESGYEPLEIYGAPGLTPGLLSVPGFKPKTR